MDILQVFNDELQSLLRTKPSVSKAKMNQITRAAMKGVKFYKHIVQAVEKFIARCRPEYMIPALYVIDSIVRTSRFQFGPERDVYTARFSRNIMMTFETLFANCLPDDRPKIVRVLNLWQKNSVFESLIVQPLMDMAITASSSARMPPTSPPDLDGGSSSGPVVAKYPSHRHYGRDGTQEGLKFSKDMLDFDYDEDEDDAGDETPTEAEPPLSSTLNKMGLEQRGHRSESKSKLYSQQSSQSSQRVATEAPPPSKPPAQEPVLERWQRIVNGQSMPSTDTEAKQAPSQRSDAARPRSRSRSPPLFQQTTRTAPSSELSSSREEKSREVQDLAARDAERAAERERRCLPKIRDKHVTVCSATLWLGHLPKSITEVDISDEFGEYGSISSIDLVPPRGCAYVCMDRRQDAKRALNESRDVRLRGCPIKMAWAPGKGFKVYKRLKDFWEADVGASFIPYSKVDSTIDFEVLEEGGVIDEDSLSIEMRERRERQQAGDKKSPDSAAPLSQANLSLPLAPMPVGINQPLPPASIQPFSVPPPNLNVAPPPIAMGQGVIPFPPPGVTTTSSSTPIVVPPPSMLLGQNSSLRDADLDKVDDPSLSIDHQLSMTERQISMVNQQLSMIQQAQGMTRNPPPVMQPVMPGPQLQAIFHPQTQPDPMIFDMGMQQQQHLHQQHQQMMHSAQNMLDPAMSMFVPHPGHFMAPPQMMIPTSLSDGSDMMHMPDQTQVIQID